MILKYLYQRMKKVKNIEKFRLQKMKNAVFKNIWSDVILLLTFCWCSLNEWSLLYQRNDLWKHTMHISLPGSGVKFDWLP